VEKKTLNAKEVLDDIKAGMDNAALMGRYQLSEKGLQSLFKKLVDGGVLKQQELDGRTLAPEKAIEAAWTCPICGTPQNMHHDKCPECSVIAGRFTEKIATTQQLGAIQAQPSPIPEESMTIAAPADIFAPSHVNKIKEVLSNPYGLAVAAIAAVVGFAVGVLLISAVGWLK
jgi:hypothetical protein